MKKKIVLISLTTLVLFTPVCIINEEKTPPNTIVTAMMVDGELVTLAFILPHDTGRTKN